MLNSRDSHTQRGQQLVEFALILPLVLLILFGIIEFSLIVFSYNTMANTGREVARYGSIHPVDTEIEQYITDKIVKPNQSAAIGLDSDQLAVETRLTDNGPLVSTIHVTVTYTYTYLTAPLVSVVGDPILVMRTTSTMYTEREPTTP